MADRIACSGTARVTRPSSATPPSEKWSAPTAYVYAVVDEVLAVGGGWRVVAAVDEGAWYGVPQEEFTCGGSGTLVGWRWDAGRSFDVDAKRQLWTFNTLGDRYWVVDVALVDVVTIERVLDTQHTAACRD